MRYTALETIDRMRAIIADPFADFENLDDRQRHVASLAAHGKTNSEISEVLGIPMNTAGSIIKAVTKRTGLKKADLLGHLVNQIKSVLDDCCIPDSESENGGNGF